jgi:hypothetical protein
MAVDVNRMIDDRLLELHTGQPGRVVTFYADTYEADVELVCRRPVPHAGGGYVYEDPPVIPRVLICSFGNATNCLRVQLAKGDLVWVLHSEVSTDEFIDTGEIAQPSNVARHGIFGGIAIPFVLPSKMNTGPRVVLADGADFVALSAKVDANFQAIKTMFTNWVVAPTDGGGALKTLATELSFGSTAAAQVKAT